MSQVVEIHRVEMDDGHRDAYNTLFNSARAAFKAALAEGESEVISFDFVVEMLVVYFLFCESREDSV